MATKNDKSRAARETPAGAVDMPAFFRGEVEEVLEIREGSWDAASRTIEICWTTGAKVRRYDWRSGEFFDEELVVSPQSIRLDRLNRGAPFLNSHWSYGLNSILGKIVENSVRIEGGKGYCKVRLTDADDVKGEVQRITEGIAKNVSVGYRIHRVEKVERDGELALWRVVDWEPYEVSSVPIPADAGAQVRGGKGGNARQDAAMTETNPCVFEGMKRDEPATLGEHETAAARMRMRARALGLNP